MNEDYKYMELALNQAKKALKEDEVPVGAIIVKDNKVIAKAYNKKEQKNQPTAHAEILAITKACKKLKTWHLDDCVIYVTLEPCVMCAGALSLARLDAIYFGAFDPKTGAILQGAEVFKHKQTHHKPVIQGGINADENGKLLTDFFKAKRTQ